MCRIADVAMITVNASIQLANEKNNKNFLMDFVKLHKLLYLGQWHMLRSSGKALFEEEIYAHQCGPYAEQLHFIPAERGFDLIVVPFPKKSIVEPTQERITAIKSVLEQYGELDTEALVELTKRTTPYCSVASQISNTFKPIITKDSMAREPFL